MTCGYTICPCCGDTTVSKDVDHPEYCSLCEEHECSEQPFNCGVLDGEDEEEEVVS